MSDEPNDLHDDLLDDKNDSNSPADDFQRDVVDRRAGADRRQRDREDADYTGPERRVSDRRTGLERRRGAGIRREEDRRSAEEGEMTSEQFEFVQAIEAFKKRSQSPYPTWSNILDVVVKLGYRVVDTPTVDLNAAKLDHLDLTNLTAEQKSFVRAVEAYKAVNKKRFPTWTEVLEVVEQLGYRKVQAREIELQNVPEAPFRLAA